ncbi:hypothetical protein PPROV_000672700 [Pycnococcus provasolii]|uniref:Uncharacterized protein n=1 Tax=Pycnococcus provasolii TaxID=41880 RepID=A0A830HMZ5_9CHLO|nr:hypothetical protein PPROV_000672700 [Pycnococcus provasolii]
MPAGSTPSRLYVTTETGILNAYTITQAGQATATWSLGYKSIAQAKGYVEMQTGLAQRVAELGTSRPQWYTSRAALQAASRRRLDGYDIQGSCVRQKETATTTTTTTTTTPHPDICTKNDLILYDSDEAPEAKGKIRVSRIETKEMTEDGVPVAYWEFAGAASSKVYTNALRALKYRNDGPLIVHASKKILFTVEDSSGGLAGGERDMAVLEQNDPPIASDGGPFQVREDSESAVQTMASMARIRGRRMFLSPMHHRL